MSGIVCKKWEEKERSVGSKRGLLFFLFLLISPDRGLQQLLLRHFACFTAASLIPIKDPIFRVAAIGTAVESRRFPHLYWVWGIRISLLAQRPPE